VVWKKPVYECVGIKLHALMIKCTYIVASSERIAGNYIRALTGAFGSIQTDQTERVKLLQTAAMVVRCTGCRINILNCCTQLPWLHVVWGVEVIYYTAADSCHLCAL
jgi:hypothetical protein